MTTASVTTLPSTDPAPAGDLLTAADRAALLKMLGMPDVSGMVVPMDMHEAADIVELRTAVQERIDHVRAVFAEILREPEALVAQATEELKQRARAGGGEQCISRTYRIKWPTLRRAGTPIKNTLKLLELRGRITPSEFAAVFNGATVIHSMLDEETLKKVKALIPGADRVVKVSVDANGTALNALKKAYGPESAVGKIISAGYIPTSTPIDGELVIEPIEQPAMRTSVDAAVDAMNGGAA